MEILQIRYSAMTKMDVCLFLGVDYQMQDVKIKSLGRYTLKESKCDEIAKMLDVESVEISDLFGGYDRFFATMTTNQKGSNIKGALFRSIKKVGK